MYTNQNLDLIVSKLSSFTSEELNYLKTKIDLILSQKRIFELSRNQPDITENIDILNYNYMGHSLSDNSEFRLSNHKTLSLSQFNIVDVMVAEMKPAKKHRRPSGMWKGKVKMPDDFDELSNDILVDFGID